MRTSEVVVFVGPSLPKEEVEAMGACRVLPPARQGDVWKVIPDRPRAIVLIDGLFEGVPSVWHKELLAAIDAGIPVYGGASMGALRAAELHTLGMVGVGRIFEWYRDGEVVDDSEVALLHGDAASGYAAMTVPLVNVRWWVRGRPKRERDRIVRAAEAIFYQDRTLERVGELGVTPGEDLKRRDARGCLERARSVVNGKGTC